MIWGLLEYGYRVALFPDEDEGLQTVVNSETIVAIGNEVIILSVDGTTSALKERM